MPSARGEGSNVVSALQRTISLGVDRFNEEKERSPCLGESDNSNRMLGSHRRILLDVLMVCWGLGTWLGVNGLFVQLPLLVQRLPEGWKLPSYMTVAVQLANVGLIAYAVLRRFLPRVPDSIYIYILLLLGTAALYLNSFLYPETIIIGGSERSIVLLALMFFAALVGCTSSVLFYPYLRHFREVYLATYLVGEGLSGFIPSVFALIQGAGGNPECVLSADNKTIETIYQPARFDTTIFLIALGCLATVSLLSFSLIDKLPSFLSERAKPTQVSKDEETNISESIWEPSWMCVLLLMACLNAFMNGVLPSVQSYSCMPYGINAYHLAVSLGAMANPTACLAGVWLQPVRARSLAAMLCAVLPPLCYILVTAVMSPDPPLHTETSGQILVVAAWVCVSAVMSYARMWVYGWTRRGGAGGMRACGAVTQLGSAVGSLTLWYFINYTTVFKQSTYCRLST